MSEFSHRCCAVCGQDQYCTPLHGENGGPFCCLTCIGKWHAEHGRKRRLGRIAIRAMHAFLEGGGRVQDLDKLKLAAMAGTPSAMFLFGQLDPLEYMAGVSALGDETIDLTPQLIDDAVKLTHPDVHPPERREVAHRTTQAVLALKPYVFPAPAPKPPPKYDQNVTAKSRRASATPESRDKYPCAECASTVPRFYCDKCRARWDSDNAKEREKELAKQREYRKRRRMRHAVNCACCGMLVRGKRKDARFCSDKCRQNAHRQNSRSGAPLPTVGSED
jgi:hypothetical protein